MRRPRSSLLLAVLVGVTLARPAPANHVVMHGGPFGGVVVQILPDPERPGTLYLAAFGRGVYKSTDGGERWVASSHGLDDPAVLALARDPVASRVLYAGTDSGVFQSRDAGQTWRRVGEGIRERNVRSLVIPPARPTVLYAATDRGVLWSWDQGVTWAPRRAGLETSDIRVIRLDPHVPGGLYAAGFGGVFRSGDGGRRWERASAGLGDRRVRALAVDRRRPGVLYAGTAGRGVFVSTDRGGWWEPLDDGLGNLTVLSLLATPTGELFAGTVGGVYRRAAAGGAWALTGEDVLTLTVTFVAADPHRSGTLYAGTGGLLFVSADGGRRWRELPVSVTGASTAVSGRPLDPARAQARREGR